VNKIEVIQEVPGMGQITATVKNADYQMVDGIMMPKSIETESPGFTIKLTLQYTLNEAINETEFAPKK